MKLRYALTLALAALFAAVAFGQNTAPNALVVGDSAPGMTISKWVKGTPVTNFEKGKIYVVEFWVTWCGPCKVSIPHLTELAKKFPTVDFVGVSVWENKQSDVAPFVQQMGDKMNYNVAMDQLPDGDENGSDGAMAKSWMMAAGQNGIPAAFIIDKEGKIAWIGHPMTMEEPLTKIVNGTYSPEDYQKAKDQQEMALKMADYQTRLQQSLQDKDDKTTGSVLDEMIADPNKSIAAQGGMMKFSWLLSKKDYDNAYVLANTLIDGPLKGDAENLNDLAWMIVDPQGKVAKKNLDVAIKAAQASVKADKNYANLDTLARVYFEKGDKAKAIATEKEAIGMATKDQKADLEAALKEYQGK